MMIQLICIMPHIRLCLVFGLESANKYQKIFVLFELLQNYARRRWYWMCMGLQLHFSESLCRQFCWNSNSLLRNVRQFETDTKQASFLLVCLGRKILNSRQYFELELLYLHYWIKITTKDWPVFERLQQGLQRQSWSLFVAFKTTNEIWNRSFSETNLMCIWMNVLIISNLHFILFKS